MLGRLFEKSLTTTSLCAVFFLVTTGAMVGMANKNAIIECGGCFMKTMAMGDIRGWKPVIIPGGQQIWFCDKAPCQQQHDAILGGSMRGLPVGMAATAPASTPEVETLQQRIMELEAENSRLRGQPRPGGDVEAVASQPPPAHIAQQTAAVARPVIHVDDGSGKAVCGADPGDDLKLPQDLAFDDHPCDACVAEWTARNEDRSTRPTAEKALSQPPPTAAVESISLAEPVQERPVIADYNVLAKFSKDLIDRLNDGAALPGPILMLPSTYPNIDLAKIRPTQLRSAIGSFFKGKGVAWIDRAEVDGKFIGIVFELNEIGEKP